MEHRYIFMNDYYRGGGTMAERILNRQVSKSIIHRQNFMAKKEGATLKYEGHCAVRQGSSMYESTMGISYMKKMQFFTWNLNLWSKRLNGLSHRVYQIKNSKPG